MILTGNIVLPPLKRGAKRVGQSSIVAAGGEQYEILANSTIKPMFKKYGKAGLFRMGVMMSKLSEKTKDVPGFAGAWSRKFEKYNDEYRKIVSVMGVAGAGVLHTQLLKDPDYRETVRALLDYENLGVTLLGNPVKQGEKNETLK